MINCDCEIAIQETIWLCLKRARACLRMVSTKCIYSSYIYIYIYIYIVMYKEDWALTYTQGFAIKCYQNKSYIYIYIYILFGPVKPETGIIPSGKKKKPWVLWSLLQSNNDSCFAKTPWNPESQSIFHELYIYMYIYIS